MDYFYIVSQFLKKSILFSMAHKSFPWVEGFSSRSQGRRGAGPKTAGFPAVLGPFLPIF